MTTETPATRTGYRLRGLPDDVLTAVRSGGSDAWGRPPVPYAATGGEPVRCCRRDATAGDELLLFAFGPAIPGEDSPYQEIGPVFAHAASCPAPEVDTYPHDWLGRPQALRAYDARGWIHPASRVHDGTDPERELAEVLAQPGVVEVHSRNLAYGCWMFAAVAT